MRILLLVIVFIAVAGACGQKGPLRLAEPPAIESAAPDAAAESDDDDDDDARRDAA